MRGTAHLAQWRRGRCAAAASAGGTRDHRVRVILGRAGDDLALGDALRPAKADILEIEVGVLGADVMRDTSHRALYPQIEAVDRIGVNRAANIYSRRAC
jgi:hypothetical protein